MAKPGTMTAADLILAKSGYDPYWQLGAPNEFYHGSGIDPNWSAGAGAEPVSGLAQAGGGANPVGGAAALGGEAAKIGGQAIGGGTGAAIGSIGGGAATGAGIGSMFLPGIGTAIGAGAGAGLGALKYFLFDRPAAERSKKLLALQTQLAPFTKRAPTDTQTALDALLQRQNVIGNLAEGGLGGSKAVSDIWGQLTRAQKDLEEKTDEVRKGDKKANG